MEKLQIRWEVAFDRHDVNKNDLLERADLEMMKSMVNPHVPDEMRSRFEYLQNLYWQEFLQTDDLDIVLSKKKFLETLTMMYQVDS